MTPGKTYRYTLKIGLQGHDVWALQINLNKVGASITEDGSYGPKTQAAVSAYQHDKFLTEDGIAGLRTQESIALVVSTPPQRTYKTPGGLLRGIMEGESGWAVGAVNWSVPGGVDCGYYQRRVLTEDFSDSNFHDAFNGSVQADLTANTLRTNKDRYRQMPAVTTDRRAWELAVLYHNWPSGAETLAEGRTLSTQPADWVEALHVPGVTTPAQWADYYISTKTVYVKVWNA